MAPDFREESVDLLTSPSSTSSSSSSSSSASPSPVEDKKVQDVRRQLQEANEKAEYYRRQAALAKGRGDVEQAKTFLKSAVQSRNMAKQLEQHLTQLQLPADKKQAQQGI